MSFDDPFDNIPDDNAEEAQQVTEQPIVEAVSVEDGVEYSLTFKGTGGYADRWLVVRFPTAEVGNKILKDPALKELLDGSIKVAEYDFKAYTTAHGARPTAQVTSAAPSQQQSQPNPSRAPQQSQEAPGGEKRFCSHGEMVFKSGVSKAGNAYKLFSCTAPRDQQCKAQYLNK